ncbi:para-nitrobenzyl esterase-like [Brevipalpus obovatus]|uniref:para-nitrobenzyl esterase-like n=1 Tax=Brevipalpus obovatus TaxID=246614 RepID=UPI003D9DB514
MDISLFLKQAPEIKLTNGPVRGVITELYGIKILNYRGIPYARPPVGEYRFLPPTKPDNWSTPINGTEYGSMCIQPSSKSPFHIGDEDCLYANVFLPEKSYYEDEGLPVMVYIHGGNFFKGSGDFGPYYDPRPLVAIHNLVLVSFNYRLGAFGFIHAGNDIPNIKSNLGFRDQIFALQWIRDNIHSFGGDPSRVTIFGNSAGSESVGLHILARASHGLFNNAIMQSGAPFYGKKQREKQIGSSRKMIEHFNCSDKIDVLSCLQKIDAQVLMFHSLDIVLKDVLHTPFKPTICDEILPLATFEALKTQNFTSNINLLAGTVANESGFLLNYDFLGFCWLLEITYDSAVQELELMIGRGPTAKFFIEHYLDPHRQGTSREIMLGFLDLVDDLKFHCPTHLFSSLLANTSRTQESSVYNYLHTQKPKTSDCWKGLPELGPCHTDELYHIFGSPLLQPDKFDRADDQLSLRMMDIWAHFAKTGEVPPQGPVDWPSLGSEAAKSYVMELNSQKIGSMLHDKFEFCQVNWHHFLQYHDPDSFHGGK